MLSTPEERSLYARAAEFMRSGSSYLLTGHVRADGDCLGAEVALFHLLRGLGKSVKIVNPDPVSSRYAFLTAATPIGHYDAASPAGGLTGFDTVCLLDANSFDRTGPLAPHARRKGIRRMVVDHHQPGPGEAWDFELVDASAPSSGVLVYRLAKKLDIDLPPPAVEAVFMSLTTDTGWFKYSNTDRETFAAAAELVERGVQPSAVYGKLFQNYARDYPIGVGVVLRGVKYYAGGRLAVAVVRDDELRGAKGTLSETEDILDLLRSVGSVEVVLLFRELPGGRAKCSARSKGDFDVHRLMGPFGGGGHRKAAGADLDGPLEAAAERVTAAAVALLSGPAAPEAP
jgi:phosphoesterase RecJ-like protein